MHYLDCLTENEARGFFLSVYRDADGLDCSNGGISARYPRLFCLHPDGANWPLHKIDVPLVGICDDAGNGGGSHLEPVDCHPPWTQELPVIGPMAGGNYAHCLDSRWTTTCPAPLHVHDRFEIHRD